MRVILPATIAALFAAGATLALAQAPAPSPSAPAAEQRQGDRMERRAARMEQRFGERMQKLKAELKLTPAQEPLFGAVEQQLRKMADQRRDGWRANRDRIRNAELPDRIDMMAERAARGATSARELSGVVRPLWATLSPEQKEIVKKNLPRRGPFGGEGRGERGRERGEGRRG